MELKLKSILSCLLACILLISSPLSCYAAGSSAGAGTGGGGTSASGNGTWDTRANTGFRFTICDGSGQPVSKILGNENIVSLDVLNSGIKGAGEFWTACATDKNQAKDAHTPHTIKMSEFLSGIKEEAHGPLYWADSKKMSLGNEVREFILKGANSGGSGGSGGGTGGETSTEGNVNEDISVTDYIMKLGTIESVDAPSASTDADADTIITALSSLRPSYVSALKSQFPDDGISQWNYAYNFNVTTNNIQHILHNKFPDKIPKVDSELEARGESIYGIRWEELPLAYEEYKKYIGYKTASLDFQDLFTMTSYASQDVPNDITNNNGTSDLNADASVLGKILNLVDKNGIYYFQLEGSAKTLDEYKSGSAKCPADVFAEKTYTLLVEGTIQGQPQAWNSKTKSGGKNYPSLVYGTAHNWAQFGQTSGWKSVYSGDSFGNHVSYINSAVVNGLMTVSDWISLDGTVILKKPDHVDKWKNSEMINKFNYGYGCHLYTAFDLGKTPPTIIRTGNPSSSTTTTKNTGQDIVINRFFRKKNKDNSYT